MPRKIIEYSAEHPYHVTARSINREWFDVPKDYAFAIFSDVLAETIERYKICVHAFVLMSNHFHLVISTPYLNIGDALRYFMTESARGIRFKSKRINHIYGGRNYKTIIKSPEYYAHCIKYIYRNPVHAGITGRVEDYKWSSIATKKSPLHGLITEIKTGHEEFLPDNLEQRLTWFNQAYDEATIAQISSALKRTEFKFKTLQNSKKRLDPFATLPAAATHCQVPGTY